MKVMKKIMTAALVAMTAVAFFSCTMDAESNNGSHAGERLDKGYEEPPKQVTGGEDEMPLFTGCFIWSEGGPQAISLSFDDSNISACAPNGCGAWGGFGLGRINQEGTAFIVSSDLSTLASVEFDVVAGVNATCAIQFGDKGSEQDLTVTTTPQHKVYNVSGLGQSNYIVMFQNINVFNSEAKKLQITNLVFKDATGKVITTFATGDVIPEK